MSNVQAPYADPGRASFEVLDTYTQNYLLGGMHPELAPAMGFRLAASKTLAQFSVVGLNSDGLLELAKLGSGAIKPIGVLAHASVSGSSDVVNGPVFYQGNFNIDALVWDASYDTDAKKLVAFQGSPSPTQVIVTKRPA